MQSIIPVQPNGGYRAICTRILAKKRTYVESKLRQLLAEPTSSIVSRYSKDRDLGSPAVRLASFALLGVMLCLSLAGCGGGFPGLDFIGLTSSSSVLDARQSVNIAATGTGNLQVIWSLSGTNCTGSACGLLTSTGNGTGLYTAPVGVSAPMVVTITGTVPVTGVAQSTTITVNPDPTITGTLPVGTVGVPYTGSLQTAGGTGARKLSLTGGALPAGLTLNTATGIISGTPTTASTSIFTVSVTDSAPTPYTNPADVTIVINGAGVNQLQLAAGVPPVGYVGTPYSTGLTASGGTPPYVYSISSGSLPAGLTLSPLTGIISGTPTAAGAPLFAATVQDSVGAKSSLVLSITILSSLSITTSTLPNGMVGTPYSATIGVTGGTAPYTCSLVSGTLPAGLSLGAGCVVSGTPTSAGTVNLMVKATDSSNPVLTTTGPVSLTISPAGLTISSGTLPAGTVGTPYSSTIGVTGGTAPYTCTIAAGTLPLGLVLGPNCLVTGIPLVAGTVTLNIHATDSSNPTLSASRTVLLTINPTGLAITPGNLPNGTVNIPYAATIPVTGGTAPYSCVVTSGTLPAGLTLGPNCLVAGTPTTAGSATLGIKATDSSNPTLTATGTVGITINPASLGIITGTLPDGMVGVSYNAQIPVAGGTAPYSCTILSNNLPAGLSLGANCVISGTPTSPGFASLLVKVTDSANPAQSAVGTVGLTITSANITFTTGALPDGTVATPYAATIGLNGGTAPYTCTITSGTLPSGLVLGPNCLVTGTPLVAETVSLGVKATDSLAKTTSGTVSLTIHPTTLILTGGILPIGTVGTPYTATIPVVGGTAPYSCSITSGTLPAGLSLGANCLISGTPAVAAVVTLGVKVTDSANPAQSATGTVVLTVTPATLILTGGILPIGTVGTPYSATIPVVGGTAPYSCIITSGTLPDGLTLGANCLISGTPTVATVVTLGVKATDSSNPAQSATGTVVLTVTPATLVLTGGVLPVGTVGTPYSATIPVLGGTAPYSCIITSGTLPNGLSLGANCLISGTPTVATSVTLGVKVTDSSSPAQSATGTVVLTVNPATLVLTGGVLPVGTVGIPYSATIPVAGGTAPYSCIITSGTLPNGLSLGANCLISGTPTTSETVTLGVRATDSSDPAQSANGTVVLTINPASLILTGGVLPVGVVGTPYTATIPVIGGTAPYSCSITSGTLPNGLSLGANCVISGTPTVAAVVTLGVKATDAGGQTANGTVILTVTPATLILTGGVLPVGMVGTPYTATIPVLGGTAPYSCSITSGTLPNGLSLGANCVISGTPTVAAVVTLGVKATDNGGQTANGTVVLTVTPATLILTGGVLPVGMVGTPYSATIPVLGGTAPYSCSITSGTLPDGLSLGANCLISGTPTTSAVVTLGVKVTDSESPAQTANGVVVLTITPSTLILTGGVLPVGTVGTPYSATIPVLGGTAPYSCSITSGTLPSGLSLGANCLISGTPGTATSVTLGVKVTDSESPAQSATGTVVLTINPATLVVTGGALPVGTVGVSYSATIPVAGGTAPYSCIITSGTLPSGLSLGANCLVSGTPTTATTVTLGVKATDSSNPALSANGTVTLTINPAGLVLTGGVLPVGVVGTPYSSTIPVIGGTAPYGCSITSGTLPSGLALGANCVISGTPTAPAVVTLGVKATDNGGQTANGTVVLTVTPATLILSGGVLPIGVVGTPYTATIPVLGGTGPYSCSITSGSLPAGLTLGANCAISGTPTAAAIVTLGVKVSDSESPAQTANGTVVLTITPATLILSGGVLPVGMVGTAYTATIPVLGGTSPHSCTITSGTLPAGLTLGAGCVISGTPTAAAIATLGIHVTDGGSPAQSADGVAVLTITPATLILTGGVLPVGVVGRPYTGTIPVLGGTSPYSCSITSGTLPAGLTLGANCAISGTPTAPAVVTLGVKVTDGATPAQTANGTVVLTVTPGALILSGGVLPVGTVGTAYTATIPVLGGTSPYTCTITSGTLPAGLSLGAGCVISGTPTAAAIATLGIHVTDGANPALSADGVAVLTITPATLILSGGVLPIGVVGTAYTATIPTLGGTAPYSCSITSGTLPNGLSLGAGCVISGTPTAPAVATLGIKVTDGATPAQTANGTVVLTVTPAALILGGGVLPVGTVGTAYSGTIPVLGGTSPYTCTITSGTLPAGLTLGAGCLVSGTPTAPAIATLGVHITDGATPAQSADGVVVLTITPAQLIISISLLPNGTVGQPYSQPISITGGVAPYSCSLTLGTLPAGLTLGAGCVVSGTPTAPALLDALTIKVTDSETTPQTATGIVTLTIGSGTLTVTSGALPNGQAGVAYSATIPVTGGTPPYTCLITSLNLPLGLTVGSNCTITGTPTVSGTVNLSVLATDSLLATATGTESLAISAAAPLTLTGSLPVAIVNQPYTQTLTAAGGVGPYTYLVSAGALPAGLNLNPTTGVVSGTPTAVGFTNVTVTATDSELPAKTAALTFTTQVIFAPTPNDVLLSGPYAFLFQGHDTVLVGALAYQTATVGSFTADGNGLLTTGELDSNHQSSNPTGATVPTSTLLGSYTIGADDRGTMVVTTFNADGSVLNNISYSISVKPAVSPATTTASGTMAEADTGLLTGQNGAGTFMQQVPSTFATGLTGSYAFGMQGDIACFPACSVNLQAGPVATVGQLSFTGGSVLGEADTNLAASNYPAANLAGVYAAADAFGRTQLSVNNPNIPNAAYPLDFAVYMVNANQAFIMSTDKHSAYMLLSGDMQSQMPAPFNNTSLSGQFVGYENAPTNPGLLGTTLQNVLNLSTASIFQGTANGAGGCTTNYVDQGGTAQLVNSLTGLGGNVNLLTDLLGTYASTGTSACTVATNGRAIFNYPAPSNILTGLLGLLGVTATAPNPRIVYLTHTNSGYFLETGYAGLGKLEKQTGGPFTLATLNGTYVYGTTPAATAVTLNASGTFTADGAGNANYVLDEDVAVGGLNVITPGVTGSGTYVRADGPNGRYTFGTDVIFAINPNRFVLVDKSALNTSPSVALLY